MKPNLSNKQKEKAIMSDRERVHPARRPSIDSLFRSSVRRKKKVKFDLATVSFQVDYPKPRRKAWVEVVPENVTWCDEVWARLASSSQTTETENIKPKENIILYCLRQLSVWQWAKLFISLVCFVQFVFAVWRLVLLFQKNYTHSSLRTVENDVEELPAFTLCLPVIIAFQNTNCANKPSGVVEPGPTADGPPQTVRSNSGVMPRECDSKLFVSSLFNQSHSEFGHQCRIRLSNDHSSRAFQLLDCSSVSKPIETFYQNERCFTYLSEVAVFRHELPQHSTINLLIHSNRVESIQRISNSRPRIFVHSRRDLIFSGKRYSSGINLELNERYRIGYHSRTTIRSEWHSFFNCQNYSDRSGPIESGKVNHISRQQCLDQCQLDNNPCPNCLSSRNPIRKDLTKSDDQLCNSIECPTETDSTEDIAQHCHRSCPQDCEQTDFEVSVKTEPNINNELDLASLNTIQVQIGRDKDKETVQLEQFPLLDGDSFLAQLGGSGAFWLGVAWLLCWIVGFFEFIYEIVQLYKQ